MLATVSGDEFWTGVWANAFGTVIGGVGLALLGALFWETARVMSRRPLMNLDRLTGWGVRLVGLALFILVTIDFASNWAGVYDRGERPPLMMLGVAVAPAAVWLLMLLQRLAGWMGRHRDPRPPSVEEALAEPSAPGSTGPRTGPRVAGHRRR